ncbi:glycosyltransferase family 2 protein [Nocardioides sp. 503]|uniref:glycosyltransferase family 2 protein n=1 Tax=Nocardioides sp. 503 TaxID=2508326 RepID=UPI00142F5BA6|nr:glycosyltransferase family 2 protein [Nocardioides sp. 503]
MTQNPVEETPRRLVSIIVPALDEAPNVPGLIERFGHLAQAHAGYDFELVVVDDGSTDGTADLVVAGADPAHRTVVVRLARRFGSHYAISAGFEACHGDAAIVLGADLQEPPSLIDDFIAGWESGSEVVWGVRRTRAGRSWTQEAFSKTFSVLFTRYAELQNYPAEGPSGVLVDRCVIDEVAKMPEHNRNVLALIAWLGFTQTRVDYDQVARTHGESRWTRRRMLQLAVDSLIQFSSMPLRLCTFAGLGVALLGVLYAIFLVVRVLVGVETPPGWSTVLVAVLLLGGMQLTVVGVIGEYLWRAVEETRARPLFVVRDVRTVPAPDGSPPRSPSVRP